MNKSPPGEASASPSTAVRVISPIEGDILYGAEEIALFLFGDKAHRRRVYRKISKYRLPVFRIGEHICARKSVLLAWIAEQEKKGGS